MQENAKNLDKKRADEKLLVSEMIALYCRRQHGTPKGTLCPEAAGAPGAVHPAPGGDPQSQAGGKSFLSRCAHKPVCGGASCLQRGDEHGEHRCYL